MPTTADAIVIDDDAEIDAAAGLVELTVYEDGALFPNTPVLFLDAADAVVMHGITNAQGVASATMLPGGSVTAVLPSQSGFTGQRVFTYLDVKPGDHLVLGTPGEPAVTTAPLMLPSYQAAASYRVEISCGTAVPSMVSATCSPVDFYVSAEDDMMRPLAWFYVPSVAVMQDTAIDLSTQSYQALTPVQVTIAGVPSTVGAFSVAGVVALGDFDFATVVGTVAPSSGATRTVTLALPEIAGGSMVISPELQRTDTKDKQTFYVRAPFAATSTIDVSTPPTPWFESANATTNEIRLDEDGSGTMDVALVHLRVERSFDDYYFWRVAGPYTSSRLRLPRLTGSFADFNVQTGNDAFHAGYAYTARLAGGWDVLRASVMNAGAVTTRLLQAGGVVATAETSIVP